MSKVQKMKLAKIGILLTKEKLKLVLGGDGSGGSGGTGSCEDDTGAVLCVSCISDSQCNYKPNLYCEASDKCPQYSKVCRKSLMC